MENDSISRAAALDAIGEQPLVWTDDDDFARGEATQWEYDTEAIKALPSAQPMRKRGKWTDNNACPFCGFQPWYERDIHTLSFCPNCGADLRGNNNGNE